MSTITTRASLPTGAPACNWSRYSMIISPRQWKKSFDMGKLGLKGACRRCETGSPFGSKMVHSDGFDHGYRSVSTHSDRDGGHISSADDCRIFCLFKAILSLLNNPPVFLAVEILPFLM